MKSSIFWFFIVLNNSHFCVIIEKSEVISYMDFPIEIILFIFGFIISSFLYCGFSELLKKHPCNINIMDKIPNFLVVILLVINIFLWVVFFCWNFTWCVQAYRYIIDRNVLAAFGCLLLNVVGCFYTTWTTKNLPRRRR